MTKKTQKTPRWRLSGAAAPRPGPTALPGSLPSSCSGQASATSAGGLCLRGKGSDGSLPGFRWGLWGSDAVTSVCTSTRRPSFASLFQHVLLSRCPRLAGLLLASIERLLCNNALSGEAISHRCLQLKHARPCTTLAAPFSLWPLQQRPGRRSPNAMPSYKRRHGSAPAFAAPRRKSPGAPAHNQTLS